MGVVCWEGHCYDSVDARYLSRVRVLGQSLLVGVRMRPQQRWPPRYGAASHDVAVLLGSLSRIDCVQWPEGWARLGVCVSECVATPLRVCR